MKRAWLWLMNEDGARRIAAIIGLLVLIGGVSAAWANECGQTRKNAEDIAKLDAEVSRLAAAQVDIDRRLERISTDVGWIRHIMESEFGGE